MSTINYIPTVGLRPSDTLLIGASMVSVDSVEPDDFADGYWLRVTCVSGNFDQFEGPLHVDPDAEWSVLNAER